MNRYAAVAEPVDVPLWSWWKRRALRRGNCLNHVLQLLDAPRPNPFEVCMGPFAFFGGQLMGLHCWLEAGEVVVDLTKKPKFWNQQYYYSEARILKDDVCRYSLAQVAPKVANGDLTFWDFDMNKFVFRS